MFKDKCASEKEVAQAVLIADNFGNEFKPISDDVPFALLPLVNIPLLEYTLEFLSLGGVEETFLFCCKRSDEIKTYLNKRVEENAPWSLLMEVRIILSETCRSFGDCLRDLDAKGLIRNNFFLIEPGTLGNIKLLPYLKKHNSIVKQDKNAAMTALFQEAGVGYYGNSLKDELVVASDEQNRVLFYQKTGINNTSKVEMPLETVIDNHETNIWYNLKDMHVAVCSPSVLSLFSDNFDFQTRDDFIRGLLLNEEILGSTIYIELVNAEQYGGSVTNWRMYQSISHDIINRWLYPMALDMIVSPHKNYLYCKNNIYKSQNVQICKNVHLTEDVVIGAGSVVGDGTTIKKSIIGDNVKIGKNVTIENSFVFSNVVIENNVILSNSVIGWNSLLKTNCKVTAASILGKGVQLPKDTCVEDVLLQAARTDDEKNKISEKAYRIKLEDDETFGSEKENYPKPITRLCLNNTDEVSDSEFASLEESEDDLSYRDSPVADDTNLFLREVIDSLTRGFEDKLSCENLILEINSSRYAYNVTLHEVNVNVIKAILHIPFQTLPCKQSTGVQYLVSLKPLLVYFTPILKNYIRNDHAMANCLQAIEEVAGSNTEIVDCVAKILEWLYDNDFLSEEAIMEWYSRLNKQSKLCEKVEPLITWLQEAEEASTSEDEE